MKRTDIPTIFVVFGATGDLMTKKIVPALFNLHEKNVLPKHFKFLGVSRRDWTDDDLKKHIEAILAVKVPDALRTKVESFLDLVQYHKIEFNALDDYVALGESLQKIDEKWGMCTNKLFYLSVPPQFYDTIFNNIHASHLADGCGPEEGWTRIVVEKPFGSDEKSAKALDLQLAKLFKEEQIYRIDHYLAKEMLQNIIAFRFGNNLFENEWDRDFIEAINIRLFEDLGVADRGGFYDGVGTLRDVGQNHLLAMLALVTMEKPERYDSSSIRQARAELLRILRIPTVTEAAEESFRAQYEGYRAIKGVDQNSKTETYFRIKGFLTGRRWEGVPIVMESGKCLGAPRKEIEIVLRHNTPCLCQNGGHHKNRIVIYLEPKEGITIKFYSKKQGYSLEIEERSLTFTFRKEGALHMQYTEEYEKLLLDCIAGDQTLFVSSAEIIAMWKFIDPFVVAWKKELVPLKQYIPGNDAIVVEADVADISPERSVPVVPKEIGIIGLGKMGANVALQLHEKGWNVIAANRSSDPVQVIEKDGLKGAYSFADLAEGLRSPKIIWIMITAGKAVDEALLGKDGIAKHLKKGDIVIDAGNSFYEDTIRRAKVFKKKGIHFMDVGFSGGPHGARHGGSLMIGGEKKIFGYLEPMFRDLSVPNGYEYFGSVGSGHFVKMVHNGIEYGMMQSLAEGFALMKKSPFKLDVQKIAEVYNRGSVVESRLVGWLEDAFRIYGKDLKTVSGSVAYTGEGEWTVMTGKKMKMKLPAIEDSFKFRVQSQKNPSYTGKILSAIRNRFGGHAIDNKKKAVRKIKNKQQ